MSGAYGDREYRAAVAVLRRDVVPCRYGCGRRATSPDHDPPLAVHQHVAGSGCCRLLPACYRCNVQAGAALGNRRRRAGSRSRLTPGSGWAR